MKLASQSRKRGKYTLFLKLLFRRVDNMLRGGLRENIVFLHLPKCGGTSINHAINCHYQTLDLRTDNCSVSLFASSHLKTPGVFTLVFSELKKQQILFRTLSFQ